MRVALLGATMVAMLACGTEAEAQNWVELARAESGSHIISVDAASIRPHSGSDVVGPGYKVWTRTDYLRGPKNGVSYYLVEYIIDCGDESFKQLRSTSYDRRGSVILSMDGRNSWDTAPPGTMFDGVVKDICAAMAGGA